ncbi:hypothetical protein KPL71_004198 [Citrus sinensis]|uniref:Uncharacterized protein n=1 Tax=Citrus sinensis TaxID=2711 RepID=A0ACB8N4S4_CITSI|nr:hypothetical protein KPL71_004198 [Citrus sinensis]
MPLEWLTNYEQFHQNSEPVQTSQAIFERRSDGQVKMSFQTPDKPSPDPPRFSYTAMITAVSTGQEPNPPIYGFSSEGYPVYPDKVNGHFLWDVPEAHMFYTHPSTTIHIIQAVLQSAKQSIYDQFFGLSHLHNILSVPLPKTTSPKRSKSKVRISKPAPKEDPAYQYHYQQIDTHNNDSDSTSEESLPSTNNFSSSAQTSSDSESQYADISGLLMAIKTEDPSTSTPVVDTPIVDESSDDNNDDVQGSQTEPVLPVPPNVLREFCSRFTGSLRDWFESLGEYRQLQLIQTTIPIAIAVVYEQFIGEPAASTEASRKEYHQMKCCSLKRHHLEMHYKRMSMLYYKLNGFNDPSLKHVFAASLLPELQPELQRQLTAFNLDIANVSLGKIFQLTMLCLDKICEQKDFFKDLIEHKEPFASAYKKPYLKIQYKDDKKCTCPQILFQKTKEALQILQKKDPSQFRKKKHNRCFICKKRRHFARNCPNKSAKSVHLIQHLQQSSILSNNEDVESIFSEQFEKDDHTAFILADSTDSYPDDIFVISTIQEINHIRPTFSGLLVKISVIPSKFHKPASVIGFLDTGAQRSILNPKILPPDYWDNHTEYFRAANGKVFETSLITKNPIGIQFFPNCIIWQKIIGSDLPDKDLLIGFDILQLMINFLSPRSSPYSFIFKVQRDFIPKVAVHTSQLSCMLKKIAPPWGPAQIDAVKQLKKIAQSPPPLKIPTTGQRILQTDASDDFWSAILLEKIGDSESYCAPASGQFKDSEKNYHVIYKEILGVKYGIKKFEFHFISHNFLIRMDNSSFPKIFDFKNKLLSDKQLLNLKTWFAKYDYTVQHIKGDKNLIPDFLTRPSIKNPVLISSIQTIPITAMYRTLPFKALTQKAFPLNLTFSSAFQIQSFAKKFLYRYFTNVHITKPERFPSLCLEHLFLSGFTIVPSLTIFEDELWPYFQHPQTKDYWTQDMAYEWKTFPHPFPLDHDPTIISTLKAYLLELNNIPPAPTDIHHTSIGPSHTLEILPSTQICTLGSSSSPHGILVQEQRPDYTNVLFQGAQDPWADFQSLLQTQDTQYTVTEPGSSSTPTQAERPASPELDEDILIYQEIQREKEEYENETGDVSPSRFPSTP